MKVRMQLWVFDELKQEETVLFEDATKIYSAFRKDVEGLKGDNWQIYLIRPCQRRPMDRNLSRKLDAYFKKEHVSSVPGQHVKPGRTPMRSSHYSEK